LWGLLHGCFWCVSIVNLAFEFLSSVKHYLFICLPWLYVWLCLPMSTFIYLCLPFFASAGLYLLLFSFLCFYLCPMFTSMSFCLPLSGLCLCLPLFAYVCFYLPMLVYLLLSPKLCELLSSKFCLFSKSFSFPIHYHVVVYYLVANVYLGPL